MIAPDLRFALSGAEQAALDQLFNRLSGKRYRHLVRRVYHDGLKTFRNLGISIPPTLNNIGTVLGWPATGVNALGRRIKSEGFVLPGGEISDFGIDEIARDNRLDIEMPQAVTSSLIHACTFISTTLGDQSLGEPEILIQVFDAEHATGLWRPASRDLGAALLVIDEDESGNPTKFYLMFGHAIYAAWRENTQFERWYVNRRANDLGRVPVEPHVYHGRLGRPFGSSRITRPAMAYTDSALRTLVRSEVGSEFYSAPQRFLLGAKEEDFVGPTGERKTTWDLLMGRILAISADEETGELPKVGQFPQISMTPHIEQFRMWAQLFAADQHLDLSQLGITTDNPASAEARYAAKEELVIEAEAACDGFEPAWVRALQTGVQMRDGLKEIPEELKPLAMRWRDPSTPSRASAVDAALKLTQGDRPIIPPESDVALELVGLSEQQIARVKDDRQRITARETVQALAALRRPTPQEPEQPAEAA